MFYDSLLYREDLKHCVEGIQIKKGASFLVTGATGLIGSFLVDALLEYERIFENRIHITATSRELEKLRKRYSYHINNPALALVQRDVVRPIPYEEQYDYILHLASNADPGSYAQYPIETILTNVLGTFYILEYLVRNKKCKALVSSSFEVYGTVSGKENISERDYGLIDYNQIRSGYPESKRVGELLVKSYVQEYSVNAVIARLCSIYGPTMRANDNKAAAQFIRSAVAGENIVLKSKGSQSRSYCYMADCVLGVLTVLIKGAHGEAYNVCNPDSKVTIAELAQFAADVAGTKVVYDLPDVLEKGGGGVTRNSVLCADKLFQLGFRPRYTVKSGLERTVNILRGR